MNASVPVMGMSFKIEVLGNCAVCIHHKDGPTEKPEGFPHHSATVSDRFSMEHLR